MHISSKDLESFCIGALQKCGLSEADARVTADVLVTTDTWGVFTHGTKSLRGYCRRLRAGGLNPTARPEVVKDGPAWAIVDGHSAIGMVTSCYAMEQAIAKARDAGIGFVSVRNSCHFGAAGYYANMAAARDMIGQAMANDSPSVTAPGSRGPVLGSNPFAFAAPSGTEKPILFDIATSAVAGGKVYIAQALGQKIPANWIVDSEGLPTTDPNLYPHNGSLLPMAGHKGYGLALMIETLSALMSGASATTAVGGWMFGDPAKTTDHGHAFVALNIGAMVPIQEFKERMDQLIREVHDAPKAKGSERVFLPGEMEWEKRAEALANGIQLPSDVVANLRGLADDLRLEWI